MFGVLGLSVVSFRVQGLSLKVQVLSFSLGFRVLGCRVFGLVSKLDTARQPHVHKGPKKVLVAFEGLGFRALLKGSWDLVTRVIIEVTILIITYNPT